jgi:hypothetical protein
MKELIEKAIQGGYRNGHIWGMEDVLYILKNENGDRYGFLSKEQMLLDPLFWQALFSDKYVEIEQYFDGEFTEGALQVEWLGRAMVFHKINLTQGFDKAVEYVISNLK